MTPPPGAKRSLKIVVIGDGSVGKTCMVWSYAKNKFPSVYEPTVFDTYTATVHVDDVPRTIELWDTAGQDDYERVRAMTYAESDVYILCFSLIAPDSFRNTDYVWMNEIKSRSMSPITPVVLVGTKLDLRDDPKEVAQLQERGLSPITTRQGVDLARKIGAVKYMECSALTQQGLKDVFDETIRAAIATEQMVKDKLQPKKCCCTIS